MRRIVGVLVGLALAAAVLAPGPALAVAAASTFQVGVVVDEGPAPTAGRVLQFDAVLVSDQDPIVGAPVTLTARPYGATSYAVIGHGTTGQDGSVVVRAALRASAQLQWTYAGDAEHAATTSFSYLRPIGSKVAAHAEDRTLGRHQKVVVVGRAAPLKPGQRVTLWRGDVPCFCPDISRTRIAVGRIRADGTFRLSARLPRPGTKQLYVQVNAGQGNAIGYSRYLHVRVR